MSERIDISRVKVTDVERSPNNAFFEKWTGSIQVCGSEEAFTSDVRLREGEEYQVIWERTESMAGEQMFVIHKVVDNGS